MTPHFTPQARQQGLFSEIVGDELVVYDQERQSASRLNRTAAAVWQLCDGARTVPEMTALLQQSLDAITDENLVLLSLQQLDRAHLLQEPLQTDADQARLSRRQALRKLGTIGAMALLLPVVTTIGAPTPAHAQSNPC